MNLVSNFSVYNHATPYRLKPYSWSTVVCTRGVRTSQLPCSHFSETHCCPWIV